MAIERLSNDVLWKAERSDYAGQITRVKTRREELIHVRRKFAIEQKL
jgi:hypothetical protein